MFLTFCIYLLQLSRHRDEFRRRSTNVPVQSPVVLLVLEVTAGACSSEHQVVIPVFNHNFVAYISKIPIRGSACCSSDRSTGAGSVSRPGLLLGGQWWRQNLSLRLRLVADDQQLFKRAPTAKGFILNPETVGSRSGAPRFDIEFAGGSTVPLLVRAARYEGTDGAHGWFRTARPTGAGAGTGRGVG